LVQLASSGEILATCATRYHLSFRKLLEWYQSQVKSQVKLHRSCNKAGSQFGEP
jgi:hypothetical protein